MTKPFVFLFAILLSHTRPLTAQSTDGSPPLDWSAFRAQVLSRHPLAKQADLYRNTAQAALLRAKGGFDPKTYGAYDSKNFNDKNYFQNTEAGVKLPTWFGLELKGAYTLANGDFLNPESRLPTNGQAAFGFNWTLGQGLMIDERRAGLQTARVGLQQGEAERAAALNDLLLEAAKTYYNWALADNQLRVFEDALQQARLRYDGVRESFLQGDKPAIDTLEAYILVQNRSLDVNFARLELQNNTIALQNFLWSDTGLPATSGDIPAGAPPLGEQSYAASPVLQNETLLQTARLQHPELRLYDAKLKMLEVERRLKNEKRKPVLDLNYNLLGTGWTFFPGVGNNGGPGILANDIKFGVQFSYPLRNRKARGDLQIAQIKIAQTEFEIQQKRQAIENKVRQYTNEINTLSGQIAQYRAIVTNRRTLLDAEIGKFGFGESSVFLINAREQSWLDAQTKWMKLLAEYRKSEMGLLWAAGVLGQE
jgi:outer membrane protein TolC